MIVKPSINFLTRDSDSKLVINSGTVVTSCTGNESYRELAALVALVATAREEFITSIQDAAHRDEEMIAIRKAKRAALVSLLRQLAVGVLAKCRGDMAVLLSSGFPVQKPTRTPIGPLPAPNAPTLRQGPTTGTLAGRSPQGARRLHL